MITEKLTLVKSIQIDGLFEMFKYRIQYPTSENVLIITGPNGFGKTQILNIIFNLFNRKFSFFNKLVFEEIVVELSGNVRINIVKKDAKNGSPNEFSDDNPFRKQVKKESHKVVLFEFFKDESLIERINYSDSAVKDINRIVDKYLPVHRISEDRWLDHRSDIILSTDELIEKYVDELPTEARKNIFNVKTDVANEILNSISTHLIKEQRLFKKVQNSDRNYRGEKDQTVMVETIQTYANELKELIVDKSQRSFIVSQYLDSSYPNRLVTEKGKVSRQDYDQKFAKLINKQEKLARNGLYESKQEVLNYSEDDAKALLVYLNDLEEKLRVFDELLEKLELFTSILNERRFTYKSIAIDREKGFYFKTISGKVLGLNELSSGEQHEVILLYELIFKTNPGILVLIDEPEISLHISWQKEFLDDLLRIVQIQNFQVMIATHSPSIINDRWDLVYNLEKLD